MIYLRAIDEFYDAIVKMANKITIFPAKIEEIVYDPRFNMPWVIDEIVSDETDESGEPDRYYYILIGDMETMVDFGSIQQVCDSSEINEAYECGDYDYYCGFLNPECPIIYQQPSHSWVFPARIIFCTPQFQIEVSSDHRYVDVYESVKNTRNMLYIEPIELRLAAVKNMLENSDRPRLDL